MAAADSARLQNGPNGWLSAGGRLRAGFAKDSFVVLPDALPAAVVESWRARALELRGHARSIDRHGDFTLVYRVVTGDVIQAHWPELWAFYHDDRVLGWVRDVTGDSAIYTSEQIRSAVNLNVIDGLNSVYRWHFDAVPYTALIYLTDVREEDGGALEVVPACAPHVVPDLAASRIVRLYPTAGSVVLMDGTRCYHGVAPMLRPGLRLSIPLVFPNRKTTERPRGLDDYLYDK